MSVVRSAGEKDGEPLNGMKPEEETGTLENREVLEGTEC